MSNKAVIPTSSWPALPCPECGELVTSVTHEPGFSAYVPYEGTYVIEGGDEFPPRARLYDVEVTPMPSVDRWTLEPCGHWFRKLNIEMDENGKPTSLSIERINPLK